MVEELFKVNRKVISFRTIDDDGSDVHYWLSKTAVGRSQAVELLRILMFGYDPAIDKLQLVFKTAEFETS